jgi:hypothetical protein
MMEKNPRERLFQELDSCLDLFHKKVHRKTQPANEQMGYGRLLLNTINTYGKLLDMEELELRIEKLEQQMKDGVLIPDAERGKKTKPFRR